MALSCLINGHYSDTPVNDQALDIPWLVNYFVEVVNITDDFFVHTWCAFFLCSNQGVDGVTIIAEPAD